MNFLENIIKLWHKHYDLFAEGEDMNNILFTIGHSQHEISYFIELLRKYEINYILDVRSTPYSQFAAQYNKNSIKVMLNDVGINYVFMGKYFGARQEDDSLYAKEGYLDFQKTAQSTNFKAGVANVLKGIGAGNRIALMCTEKDPIECHRAILVGKAFWDIGVDVEHIMPDASLQSQDFLNERLMNLYYPDRAQINLFSENNLSEEECLRLSYMKQNQKIGYHKDEGWTKKSGEKKSIAI